MTYLMPDKLDLHIGAYKIPLKPQIVYQFFHYKPIRTVLAKSWDNCCNSESTPVETPQIILETAISHTLDAVENSVKPQLAGEHTILDQYSTEYVRRIGDIVPFYRAYFAQVFHKESPDITPKTLLLQ